MKMRYIGALWLTMYGSGTWKMASIAPPFLSAAYICQLNGFAYIPLISCEQKGCFGETPGFQALRCTLSGCGRQAAAKERRRPPMPFEKNLEKLTHPSCQWRYFTWNIHFACGFLERFCDAKKSAAVTGTFDEVFPPEAPSSEAVMKSEKLLFSCEIWNKTPIAGWLVELNMRIFPKYGEHKTVYHPKCIAWK